MEIFKLIFKLIFSPIYKFLSTLDFDSEERFISEEGWEILNDPHKKKKLNEMIDDYRKNGIWDFTILEK